MSDSVGLNIREQATSRSQCLGLLLRDSLIEVGEHSPDKKWARIVRIVEGQIESVREDGSVPPEAARGWVFLPELDAERAPAVFDQVVALDPPHPIKQGDIAGYLGEDVPARAQPIAGVPVTRKMLHLEMFSGDDLPAYLAASRQWAREHVPDSERTLLVLRPGDALLDTPNGKVAFTLNVPHVAPLSTLEAKEVEGKRWRKVAGISSNQGEASGWVLEQGRLASPWEWPGFEVLDETANESGSMWQDLAEAVGWTLREAPRPEETPFYQGLRKMLDTNHDGKVSEEELDAALRDRVRAGRIGRIIARHDSEWADASMQAQLEWMRALAEQLGPKAMESVQSETPRANKLPWWDEVAACVKGFPKNPKVYHFHPGGVAGNHIAEDVSNCAEKFRKTSPIILRHEGGFVNDPADPGGATNMGIAWPTWQACAKSDLGIEPTLANLKALTREQAETIYLKRYWEPRGFCSIDNVKTALMIYDWTITSGKAVREVQEVLTSEFSKQITVNNVMSKSTIDAINSVEDQEHLVQRIAVSRKAYYTSLTVNADGTNNVKVKFLKGWHNRVDDCLRAQV